MFELGGYLGRCGCIVARSEIKRLQFVMRANPPRRDADSCPQAHGTIDELGVSLTTWMAFRGWRAYLLILFIQGLTAFILIAMHRTTDPEAA